MCFSTKLLTFIIAMLLVGQVRATHIVGGVINYECLGYNATTQQMTVRITMFVYRDAINGQAPFDNPAPIAIYTGTNSITPFRTLSISNATITTVPMQLTNPCLAIPPNVRVEEAVYTTTTTLPFNAAGYHISYQRCCRNQTINNLTNPGAVGATYTIFMSGAAMTTCNSSPRFRNFPPIAICRGQELNFDHSATDANGNRLEYELCTPIDGGDQINPAPSPPAGPPYANVPFSAGFTPTNPMPANPALSIDRNTGLLTGIPTQIGQYVVGICVIEYNASNNIVSRTMRDFQFNVSFCENRVTALLQADSVSADSNRFYFRRCGQTSLTFLNQSRIASAITGYAWNFSGGQSTTQANPAVNFGAPGLYTGTLVANPGNAICTDTAFIFIDLQPLPVAAFTVAIDSCNPARPPVQFNNTSTVPAPYAIHTQQWTLGNGSTSALNSPTTNYSAPGTYTVQLSVTSGVGCIGTTSRTIQYFPPATAGFTVLPQTGCAPLTTQFTNTSQFTTAAYTNSWNFGDGGATSTANNPSRIYILPNTYTAELTVRSPWGCLSTFSRDITAFEPPTAVFTVAYDSCIVDTVRTTNLSLTNQAGTSLVASQWIMADGNNYGTFNASHLYQLANTYPIQLIVTDANGCRDTATRPIQWYPAPIIDITNVDIGCAPLLVTFNNQSYPINGYTTTWNFGNGITSLQASPSVTYTNSGLYPVSLTIVSPVGCIAAYSDTILVNASPNANFSMSYDSCVVGAVSFDEQSTPNAAGNPLVSWQWNFADGSPLLLAQDTSHQYAQVGDYNVALVVTDVNGCRDTALRLLRYYPAPIVAVASSDDVICQFESISFVNSSSPVNAAYNYTWNFGDGTTSTAISPTHQYTQFGVFPIRLLMVSPIGCRAEFLDTVLVHQIPNANFTVSYDSCAFVGVQIRNTSTPNLANNALTNWDWTFGDGGTASNINDTLYPYAPRQNYVINLFLEDSNGCRDTAIYNLPYFPSPVFPVPLHSQVGCLPQTVVFDNNQLNNFPGYTFQWNLGNGVFSNAFDTTIAYTERGTYFPVLTVQTATGCIGTFRDTIVVNGIPQAAISYSYDPCAITPVTFRNRSTPSPDGIITDLLWNFGDGGTSTLPLALHTYNFPDTGAYNVSLQITDANGCAHDTTIIVDWRPNPIFPLTLTPSDGCLPLLAAAPNDNPYPVANYVTQWTYGDGTTSNQPAPADYYYTTAGEYVRQLIVIAPNGCRDTFSSAHTALAVPVADFSFAPNPITHYNPQVQFTDLSIDAAQWEWHFGLNRIPDYRYQQNPSFTYADTGVFVVQLVAQHQNGCRDTIEKPLDIIPQFTYFLPNAFTPNGDGKNDGFRGNGVMQYISEFDMQIFNRWGELIFSTTDPYEAWNGRKNNVGERCQAGVYVVQVQLKGPRGEREQIRGFATIVN
jgi:gliding motility-associated-like protein